MNDDQKCSDILQDIRKTGRHMTNEEWDFFKKVQYAARYFTISSEYFDKLKNKYEKENK